MYALVEVQWGNTQDAVREVQSINEKIISHMRTVGQTPVLGERKIQLSLD